MRAPLPSPRRIAVGAGLALLAAGLTPLAASANPAGTGLVISEVFLGGGTGGSTYGERVRRALQPDHAEARCVGGLSVQYACPAPGPGLLGKAVDRVGAAPKGTTS